MFSDMKFLLTILTLSCLVALASSINCYQCQYAKCVDEYDVNRYSSHLGSCGDGMYCVKYKTIVWIHDSGEITGKTRESAIVTRTCQSKKGQKEGCIGWQNNGGVTLKCWCGTDGCNSGTSLRPMITPALLTAFLGTFLVIFSLRH